MGTEIFLEKLIIDGVRLNAVNGTDLKIQPGKTPFTDAEKALLKEHKQAIIHRLGNCRIGRMSYQQERLWYLEQLGMGDQYLVPGVVAISGNFDVQLLQRSINGIVSRHEILRTNFIKINHLPCQKVRPDADIRVALLDLTAFNGEKARTAKESALREFFTYRFCLEEGALFKILWIKLGPEKSVLAVAMHHIITDGWSMQVLLKELSELYGAGSKNCLPDIAALQLQYADYAAWQRDSRQERQYLPSLKFWQEKLSGYQDLDMPSDRVRKAVAGGPGNFLRFDLDAGKMQAVREFAKDNDVSPFSIFAASVYYMIYKFSGQSDICLGMPVANREHPELEKLIGFFVNTVVLRLNEEEIDGQTSEGFIKEVYGSILEAQDHQGVPIEKILEFLQPPRDAGRSPVFQILINYGPVVDGRIILGESILEPSLDLEAQRAKFDLTFTFNESSSGPSSLFVEYATDLYDEGTIGLMGGQILDRMLLFVQLPGATLDKLQAQYSLKNWDCQEALNGARGDYPSSKTIHQLFEEQAVRSGANPAIRYKNETLTYRKLDAESSQLAAYLESISIAQNYPVGICMEQSPKLISTILGVLKSGAAYLPIDEAYPEAYLNFIAEDSGIRILLCDDATYPRLEFLVALPGLTLINLDDKECKVRKSETALTHTGKSSDCAYLMYTSGTSGAPKGVVVSHASVINHNYAVKSIYSLGESVPVLQFSSPAFDIFVEEVFATLLFGGVLVMLDKGMRTDNSYLKKEILDNNIAIANFPTAYWNAISSVDFSKTSLHTVIIGGEKAEASLLQRWYGANPKIRIINTYGPTEATVIALYHVTSPADDFTAEVPLGKPIANIQAYVLDDRNNPVAQGMQGELYISGDGLATGYWNDEILTREKFIYHPGLDSKRMYKTGDKARWNAKGQLEFLGRMDEQVKIRGFRIEPEYIENMLLSHKDISGAAVIVKQSGKSNSLAAFIATSSTGEDGTAKFMAFLKELVPPYMLPERMIAIDAIPLKTNGKVDKKKLASLDSIQSRLSSFRAAVLPWEIKFSAIWEEVLGRKLIGIDDDFFSIGGHSLMSVQLVSTLNEKFGLSFSVMDVLRYPTISDMAGQAELRSGIPENDPDIVVLKKGRRGAGTVFIIPGMPGLSDGYYEMAQQIEGSDVYGLQMKGFRDGDVSESVEAMARHNIDLMLKACASGPVRLMGHSYGCTVLYEMLYHMEGGPWQVEQVVLVDGGRFLAAEAVAHSSILLFFKSLFKSFAIDDARLLDKVEKIIRLSPKAEWQKKLDSLFSDFRIPHANPFFTSVWKVVATALSVQYSYPHGKLPHCVQLVVASGSLGWLKKEEWDGYFTAVHAKETEGDHMSIIRQPGCNDWVAATFNRK